MERPERLRIDSGSVWEPCAATAARCGSAAASWSAGRLLHHGSVRSVCPGDPAGQAVYILDKIRQASNPRGDTCGCRLDGIHVRKRRTDWEPVHGSTAVIRAGAPANTWSRPRTHWRLRGGDRGRSRRRHEAVTPSPVCLRRLPGGSLEGTRGAFPTAGSPSSGHDPAARASAHITGSKARSGIRSSWPRRRGRARPAGGPFAPFRSPSLEALALGSRTRDLGDEVGGDADDTVGITHDHVAGEDGHASQPTGVLSSITRR